MAGAPKKPGDPSATARPAAKKKGPKKPRLMLTPMELSKLNHESAKRRARWTREAKKKAAADFAAKAAALQAAQHKAAV